MEQKVIIGEGKFEHKAGDKECSMGWCNVVGWPKECQCGGLIHAEFGDEDMDCNYFLYTKCDKCGAEDTED